MDENTRVFFVVDSREANEEIYETLEKARAHYSSLDTGKGRRIYVAIVRNAFQELDGEWNYEDSSNTFSKIWLVEKE
jgi:hypothetical protein